MAAVTIPVAAINPRMSSASNLTAIAMDAALLMIVAGAQMLIILTRNIDLLGGVCHWADGLCFSKLHASSP